MQKMTSVYAKLIVAGVKYIEDVPEHLKDDVQAVLEQNSEESS